MNPTDRQIEIDAYLNGTMPERERLAFEAQLQESTALAEEVSINKLANDLLVDAEVFRLKSKMQAIHEDAESNSTSRGGYLLGIGLLLLAIGALAFIIIPREDETDKPLAQQAEQSTNKATTLQSSPEKDKPPAEEQVAIQSTTALNPANAKTKPETTKQDTQRPSLTDPDTEPKDLSSGQTGSTKIPPAPAKTLPKDSVDKDPPKTDPCIGVADLQPSHQLESPCFGNETGTLTINRRTGNQAWSQYSIDGGENFSENTRFAALKPGNYELIARDENGCLSRPQSVALNYRDCNFAIQPSRYSNWTLDIPSLDYLPLILEIRHALTGAIVFEQTFQSAQPFEWNGIDSRGSALGMGNYLYFFRTTQQGILAKGQITIIE